MKNENKKPIETLVEKAGLRNAVKWVTIVEEMLKQDRKEQEQSQSPVA